MFYLVIRLLTFPAWLLYRLITPTTTTQLAIILVILTSFAIFFLRRVLKDNYDFLFWDFLAGITCVISAVIVAIAMLPSNEENQYVALAKVYQPSAITTTYKTKSTYKKIYANTDKVQFKDAHFDTSTSTNNTLLNLNDKQPLDIFPNTTANPSDIHNMTAAKDTTTKDYLVRYTIKDLTITYDKGLTSKDHDNADVTINNIYARKETRITKVHGKIVETKAYHHLKIDVSIHTTKTIKDKATIQKIMN